MLGQYFTAMRMCVYMYVRKSTYAQYTPLIWYTRTVYTDMHINTRVYIYIYMYTHAYLHTYMLRRLQISSQPACKACSMKMLLETGEDQMSNNLKRCICWKTAFRHRNCLFVMTISGQTMIPVEARSNFMGS